MMLWFYILDTCNHAGIWKPNKKLIELLTAKKIELAKALSLLNQDKKRIRVLKNDRWFIEDFIAFQYGNHLNDKNRVHNSILIELEKNGISLTSIRGLQEVKDTLKDKDEDKDKDKDKGVLVNSTDSNTSKIKTKSEKFQQAWKDYLEMRSRIRKPATERAKELALKDLEKFSNGDESIQIQILEQSVLHSWTGVFELKQQGAKNYGRQTQPQPHPDKYKHLD